MGQVQDRTVVPGKRWTDGELLVVLFEFLLIAYLQPFIASVLVILTVIAVAAWVAVHSD
jgi:hypothetical protein